MEQAEVTEGKRRVRECLIEPLEAEGMARTAATKAAHDEFLGKLESALCYLSEDELLSLGETIQRGAVACAKCRARAGWPGLVTIRNWAHDLRPRPAGYSPKVTSWMRSTAGERCWLEDSTVAVEALRYLLKFPGVPSEDNGGMRTVREWAERAKRDLAQARALLAEGTGGDAERRFVTGYERRVDEVRALVYPDGERADAA